MKNRSVNIIKISKTKIHIDSWKIGIRYDPENVDSQSSDSWNIEILMLRASLVAYFI